MNWFAIVLGMVTGWVVIGAFHELNNGLSFNAYVKNWVWDEANSESLPKNIPFPHWALTREILRNSEELQLQNAIFTILLGPIGPIGAGMDWIVRHWPECLVVGGHPKEDERISNLCATGPAIIAVMIVAVIAGVGAGLSLIISLGWGMFWIIYNLFHSQPSSAATATDKAGNSDRFSQPHFNKLDN